MPKKPAAPKVSEAERVARSRTLKGSEEMRAAFDIRDDFVRETVRVDSLPDPPGTEVVAVAQTSRKQSAAPVNVDEAVMNILREEAEEIGIRLERFGIAFTPQMRQDMTDHVFALLALNAQGLQVTGGAIARR